MSDPVATHGETEADPTVADLVALRKDLDALRDDIRQSREERWFKKPSIVVSILALVFSFGTTAFSAYNTHQEEIRSNRRDVRTLLQRLSKLPIENYELMQRFKGSGQGEALSGMLNQENILLSVQAAEAIERFPGSFASTEYFAVASALATSNITARVPGMFARAIESAANANDYNVAARSLGGYLYAKGEYTEGRRLYAQAMEVWNRFPERNTYVVNSTELVTLMYWSQAEFGAGNKAEARQKLDEARKRLALLTPGPFTDSLRNQIDYTAKFVE